MAKPAVRIPHLPAVPSPQSNAGALSLLLALLSGAAIGDFDLAGSQAFQESALTIAGGIIDLSTGAGDRTAHFSAVTVDTQAAAASDDLDTINGGRAGMLLWLRPFNTARTVVLRNGTGNIVASGDVILDTATSEALLFYAASSWIVVAHQGAQSLLDFSVLANADLTLTGAAQDVPGCTYTAEAIGIYEVWGTFDFSTEANANDNTRLGLGNCVVNGVTQAGQAIFAFYYLAGSIANRATITQRWRVTTTAANQVIKLQAYKTGGTGASKIYADHTRLGIIRTS